MGWLIHLYKILGLLVRYMYMAPAYDGVARVKTAIPLCLLHHPTGMQMIRYTFGCYTANEGPVRIQYKCLVPIYVFPKMKLRGLVPNSCISSICERFVYSQDWSAYLAAAK